MREQNNFRYSAQNKYGTESETVIDTENKYCNGNKKAAYKNAAFFVHAMQNKKESILWIQTDYLWKVTH